MVDIASLTMDEAPSRVTERARKVVSFVIGTTLAVTEPSVPWHILDLRRSRSCQPLLPVAIRVNHCKPRGSGGTCSRHGLRSL